ncbi:helix-turn-helix domain-containing protein [Amycolatopsis thailandensis]|uniref:helix-turn-helix domain-containing protein n=1 Tax=Amycolatopsis thailandensis TaxID=589330 RepID=UPI003649073E
MTSASKVPKGKQVTGAARSRMCSELKKMYERGSSIRDLTELTDRSYGFIHQLLLESGVQLRGRGGRPFTHSPRRRAERVARRNGAR